MRVRKSFAVPLLSAVALIPFACENDRPSELTEPPRSEQPPRLVPNFGALAGRLPSTDTVTSSVPAFEIKQKGGGIAGRFEITNANSAAIALDGVHSGTGHALLAWNLGMGRAAVVITSNSNNTLPALDVSSQSLGTSTLGAAADIRANNVNAVTPAAQISTLGLGPVLNLNQKNTSSAADAATITNAGLGNLFVANHTGGAGNLAVFQLAGVNKVRLGRNGRGFFNNGVQTGGADVAESFAVEGSKREYEPGDVLSISEVSDRKVVKSNEAYSTRVIGVYATKPGIMLTEHNIDETPAGNIPVGVLGVIPTKVSAENGVIRRGDLLVAAATPGHAMKGTEKDRMLGAIVGKALSEFSGPGTGVISVLVNVK